MSQMTLPTPTAPVPTDNDYEARKAAVVDGVATCTTCGMRWKPVVEAPVKCARGHFAWYRWERRPSGRPRNQVPKKQKSKKPQREAPYYA